MSSTAAGSAGARTVQAARVAGWLTAAAGFGAAAAYGAYVIHPAALPGALVLLTLGAVTIVRPLVGFATVFPLLVVGYFGVVPGPPWLLGAGWSALLLGLALVTIRGHGDLPRLPSLAGVLALFAVVATASTVAAGGGAEAVPVLRSLLTGLALFFSVTALVKRPHDVLWPLAGATIAASLVALYAAYQWRFGDPLGTGFLTDTGMLVSRVSAGFGHPNQLGGFLVILVPYVIGAAMLLRRARPLIVLGLLLCVFGIYVSFSRGSLLGLAVVPFFFLPKRRMLTLAPLLGVLVLALAPDLLRERIGTLTEGGTELSTRVDIWTTAWQIWLANPLLGVGPGGFPDAYASAPVAGKQFLPATIFEAPPHAHNVILQVLAELGLAGILSFAAILGLAIWAAMLSRRSDVRELRVIGTATLASLSAFVIHNMFDVTLLETNGIFFWSLLGLVSAAANLSRSTV